MSPKYRWFILFVLFFLLVSQFKVGTRNTIGTLNVVKKVEQEDAATFISSFRTIEDDLQNTSSSTRSYNIKNTGNETKNSEHQPTPPQKRQNNATRSYNSNSSHVGSTEEPKAASTKKRNKKQEPPFKKVVYTHPPNIPQRKVIWSNHSPRSGSYYSGAYLLPIQGDRLSSVNAKGISNLESVTFVVGVANKEHAMMAVDWLDFSVEHLSRWVKRMALFDGNQNNIAATNLLTNLRRYVQETPARIQALPLSPSSAPAALDSYKSDATTNPKMNTIINTRPITATRSEQQLPLLHPTVGVIAAGTWWNRVHTNSAKKFAELSQNVSVAVLSGTVASMMRAGFGRIVLVVATDDDIDCAKATIAMMRQHFSAHATATATSNNKTTTLKNSNADRNDVLDTTEIELTYVVATEELYRSKNVKVHRAKAAIYGIQQAVLGNFNASYTNQWLGTRHEHNYWKYVYFTEYDLLLQTRPTVLPSIHQALEDGYVLFPFRVEKLPHELDLTNADGVVYNGSKALIPAKYDNILSLDVDEDMCCDGGIDRPEWNISKPLDDKCVSDYWLCGFRRQVKKFTDDFRHRRILKHAPFYRLKQGTNLVNIPATKRRRCYPRKRRSPEDFCEIPLEYETIEKPDHRLHGNRRRRGKRKKGKG